MEFVLGTQVQGSKKLRIKETNFLKMKQRSMCSFDLECFHRRFRTHQQCQNMVFFVKETFLFLTGTSNYLETQKYEKGDI